MGTWPFTSGVCDALNIKPSVDKDMTLLAYFKKSNPSKAVLPSPTGPLLLRMPSSCIEAANKCVAEELEEQATQRPSWPQNQPNKERMRSTHPEMVIMHGTTATIRPHDL